MLPVFTAENETNGGSLQSVFFRQVDVSNAAGSVNPSHFANIFSRYLGANVRITTGCVLPHHCAMGLATRAAFRMQSSSVVISTGEPLSSDCVRCVLFRSSGSKMRWIHAFRTVARVEAERNRPKSVGQKERNSGGPMASLVDANHSIGILPFSDNPATSCTRPVPAISKVRIVGMNRAVFVDLGPKVVDLTLSEFHKREAARRGQPHARPLERKLKVKSRLCTLLSERRSQSSKSSNRGNRK